MKTTHPHFRSGQSIIEIVIVFAILGVLSIAGISMMSSYGSLQTALQAGADLRTIEVAQKTAVINGLNNPTLLTGYGTATWPITMTTLQTGKLLDPSLTVLQHAWVVNVTTIPPTLAIDASAGLAGNPYAGTQKNPNVNQSGDGMFDVGHDTYYDISSLY
jgi:type II secretory pathway pseudopilin PulG